MCFFLERVVASRSHYHTVREDLPALKLVLFYPETRETRGPVRGRSRSVGGGGGGDHHRSILAVVPTFPTISAFVAQNF